MRRGLLGTVLITIGALSPAYLPRNSPWWRLFTELDMTGTPVRLVGSLITMGGLFLLLDAWFPAASPARGQRRRPTPTTTCGTGRSC